MTSADQPEGRLALRLPLAMAAVVMTLYAVAMVRCSWLGDDAFITFRVVENVLDGYGPRWNVFERCQAYTHPLWMLLLVPVRWLAGSMVWGAYGLSWACSLAAVALLLRCASSPGAGALWLACLVGSRAFVDYSTSGLENPLTYLLLAAMAVVWLREDLPPNRRFGILALLLGLAITNRHDVLLLGAPMAGMALWQAWRGGESPVRLGRLAVAGMAPHLLWTGYSLFYYGFPFPNTAYAKLGNGIPLLERIPRGLEHFAYMLGHDPLGLLTLALALGLCLGMPKARPLALGGMLYLAYFVSIGGDFMAGRFFAAPLFLAVLGASRWPLPMGIALTGAPVILFGGLLVTPHAPLLRTSGFSEMRFADLKTHGIIDEAAFYFNRFTVLRPLSWEGPFEKHWRVRSQQALESRMLFQVFGASGAPGYFLGPEVTIVEPWALTSPLLARIPAVDTEVWRPGHIRRFLPQGFMATISSGRNRLADADLRLYYSKLSVITQGPLWSPARLRTILRFNLGAYEDRVDWSRYRCPDAEQTTLSKAGSVPGIRFWIDLANTHFRDAVEIDLEGVRNALCLNLGLSPEVPCYEATLLREGQGVWRWEICQREGDYTEFIHNVQLSVPPEVATTGYDALALRASDDWLSKYSGESRGDCPRHLPPGPALMGMDLLVGPCDERPYLGASP